MPYCAYCGSDVRDPARYICPSCSKPHSGAPLAPPRATTSPAAIIVIAVAVCVGFVAIAGILAAIAIPNLLTAMQRSKQKRSMVDIRKIATAVEAYAIDHNRYPPPEDLESSIVPTYIKSLPKIDGWGRPFRYDCWTTQVPCDTYAVGSAAKDGQWEHEPLREYAADTATTNFNADIVYSNGKFVQYPEGIHR
jgi:type II secretory pathway pseudopilin PulG